MTKGMRFSEAMAGTWRRSGEGIDRPIRFDVVATTPSILRPLGTVGGELEGTLDVEGLAKNAPAEGTIEVSPVEHRRIRYTLDCVGEDGSPYRLDGWKSIDWLRPLSTWTTLPASIYDQGGEIVGTATLRFPLQDTPSLLRSMRAISQGKASTRLEDRRWDGRPNRLEVWYDTFTDPTTGDGFWLHHELVAPSGGQPAYLHGWAALFPADGVPVWERFGPTPAGEGRSFVAGDIRAEPGLRSGSAGSIAWELRYEDHSDPLFTFPAAIWRRELLPGAQVVPSPRASFGGSVKADGRAYELDGAVGAAARIYGHGNADRWGWLHADLGDGEVIEIVAAVPRRPGLRRLPPLPLVQLRLGGRDWPVHQLSAAPLFKAHLDLPSWRVEGRVGNRRLRVNVDQPPDRCVRIPYADPDGASATCTNTERADAHIVLEHKVAGRWQLERRWQLAGTAHAEIGTRP